MGISATLNDQPMNENPVDDCFEMENVETQMDVVLSDSNEQLKINDNSAPMLDDLYNIEVDELVKMIDNEPKVVQYVGALMNNFSEYIPDGILPDFNYQEVLVDVDEEDQPSASDIEIDALLDDMFNTSNENIIGTDEHDEELDALVNSLLDSPIENVVDPFAGVSDVILNSCEGTSIVNVADNESAKTVLLKDVNNAPIEMGQFEEIQNMCVESPSRAESEHVEPEQMQAELALSNIFPDFYWNID